VQNFPIDPEVFMSRLLIGFLIFVLDFIYRERPYCRFYVLETIGRVPYFAFMSVLDLYETLGWRHQENRLKVHFAESWNELHHLLIMEELCGDRTWRDRIFARLIAFFYYWLIIVMYLFHPQSAYRLMELLEEHAYRGYDQFAKDHKRYLLQQNAPQVALNYYRNGDIYMFDEFQAAASSDSCRPDINNLYDVIIAIRDDELEHFMTMVACQHGDRQDIFQRLRHVFSDAEDEQNATSDQITAAAPVSEYRKKS
jgi:ubiquinol oxidase